MGSRSASRRAEALSVVWWQRKVLRFPTFPNQFGANVCDSDSTPVSHFYHLCFSMSLLVCCLSAAAVAGVRRLQQRQSRDNHPLIQLSSEPSQKIPASGWNQTLPFPSLVCCWCGTYSKCDGAINRYELVKKMQNSSTTPSRSYSKRHTRAANDVCRFSPRARLP